MYFIVIEHNIKNHALCLFVRYYIHEQLNANYSGTTGTYTRYIRYVQDTVPPYYQRTDWLMPLHLSRIFVLTRVDFLHLGQHHFALGSEVVVHNHALLGRIRLELVE